MQRRLLDVEDARPDVQQMPLQAHTPTDEGKSQQSASQMGTRQKTRSSGAKKKKECVKKTQQPVQQSVSNSPPDPGKYYHQ